MDFCNKCGAPLIFLNSVLVCKRCNEEEYLNELQIIENTKYIKRKEKYLTFPDPRDVLVCRLKQPEVYIEKQRNEKLGPNLTTLPFYEFLHKLIEQYSPIDFKYVKGNPWSSGNVRHKYGLLFIRNELVKEIKKTVEEFILSDGEHYTLEELNKSLVDKRKLIKSLSDEMEIKWDKDNSL